MIPPIIDGRIPPGTYLMLPDETITLDRQRIDAPGVVIHKAAEPGMLPAITLYSGSTLTGVSIISGGSYVRGVIEVRGSGVELIDVSVRGGWAGIWVRAGREIELWRCSATHCAHNLYLGDPFRLTPVERVDVHRGVYSDATSSDGIKTVARTRHIWIGDVVCERNADDGIDLFAGGRDITIERCTLRQNGVQGIDIKTDALNYPPSTWGQIQNILISDCEISQNGRCGVKVWRPTDWPADRTQPRGIKIIGCRIHENAYHGVMSRADYTAIERTEFRRNSRFGVYLLGIARVASGAARDHMLTGGEIIECDFAEDGIAGVNLNLCDSPNLRANRFAAGGMYSISGVQSIWYEHGSEFVGWGEGDGRSSVSSLVIPE